MLGPFMLYESGNNNTLDHGVNMYDIWTALEICGSVPSSTPFGSWSWVISAMPEGCQQEKYGV